MLMECHLGKCRNQFKSSLLSKDQPDIFKGFFEDDTRIKKCLIYFKVYLVSGGVQFREMEPTLQF